MDCLQSVVIDFMIKRDTAGRRLEEAKFWEKSKWKKIENACEEASIDDGVLNIKNGTLCTGGGEVIREGESDGDRMPELEGSGGRRTRP